MKNFLFLFCFMVSFLAFSVAKAIPIKQKKHFANESPKAKSANVQIAILSQNHFLFEGFAFEKPTDNYLGCVVKYKKERYLFPKNAGKPCKIPIRQKVRNKDNI